MAGKTKKDLESDNALLKEELSNVKNKLAELSKKYENLQNKERATTFVERNISLRCQKCDKSFESLTDLKDHKNEHRVNGDIFKCDQCDTEFNEECKLFAHVKSHKEYACEQCSKTFPYLNTKNKHIRIRHENIKLYCHFYNNKKTCPFDEECVFLHEDAEICRYGARCEQDLCMFKHDDFKEIDNSESVTTKDSIWNVIDETENDDGGTKNIEDNLEMTFQNPSESKENNVTIDIEEGSPVLVRCEHCNFETSNQERMKRHDFEIHSVKGKYICIQCEYEFDTRKKFNSHNYHGCG